MRLGLFVMILAALLLDIGLLFPIVVDTAPPPGTEKLPADSPVRCLRFSDPRHPYWPDLARLDTTLANGPRENLWYGGSVRLPDNGDWVYRRWRPSGKDSTRPGMVWVLRTSPRARNPTPRADPQHVL